MLCPGGGTTQIQQSAVIIGTMNENALKSGFGSVVETNASAGKTERKQHTRVRAGFLLKRVENAQGSRMVTGVIGSLGAQKTNRRT